MITLLAFLIALSPGFVIWRTAVRNRKLAQARTRMAQSVTRMETLLLSSTTVSGDCVHDHVFVLMRLSQFRERYALRWDYLRRKTDAERSFEKKLKAELLSAPAEVRETMANFINAYFAAYKFSRPVVSRIHLLYSIAVLLVLQITHRGLKTALQLMELRRQAKQEIVAHAMEEEWSTRFALA